MVELALLLLFPLLWPLAAKMIWKHEITYFELSSNIIVGLLISAGGWALGHYAQVYDNQVLNGQLVHKERDEVSCEHTYSCNCRKSCSGTGSNRSCHQVCDTCKRHAYDVDWLLHSDVGSIKISRVNSRGDVEPPRWTQAKVGDPFALTSSYVNYIKAAPDSLFNHLQVQTLLENYAQDIPAYPLALRDYHYLDRVLLTKLSLPAAQHDLWNQTLAEKLKLLGKEKQANVVVVLSGHADANFAEALNASWLGGKKNDVIVVLGAPRFPEIAWVRVFSWTDAQVFKVQLRDALLDLKTAEPEAIMNVISKHVHEGFVRKPMADFEYLKYEVQLSWQMWLLLLSISMVSSIGMSFALANNSIRDRKY